MDNIGCICICPRKIHAGEKMQKESPFYETFSGDGKYFTVLFGVLGEERRKKNRKKCLKLKEINFLAAHLPCPLKTNGL